MNFRRLSGNWTRAVGPVLVIVAMILWADPAWAQYHKSGSAMICSDCHTMHFSEEGGEPTGADPGGPWKMLLITESASTLCLACHDGSDSTAPDVIDPVTMYDSEGDEHSAGGYFEGSTGTFATSHDLGVSATPPYSTKGAMTLSCATCHNPHGTDNYRNLESDPDTGGTGTTVVLDTDVFQDVTPLIPPTQAGSKAAYKRSNIGYKANYSNWCMECHDQLATTDSGTAPAHFQRHPIDVGLNSQSPQHTDTDSWTTASPPEGGFQTGLGATGDTTFGVPRVRFQDPDAVDYTSATTVDATNEVFCGSCHVAHGWKHEMNLVMPWNEGSTDMYAPCIQCHNK